MIEKLQLRDIKRVGKIDNQKKALLRETIKQRGFNYNRGLVTVSKDNIIIDGNHRYEALVELYGRHAYMKVKRKNISYWLNNFLFYLLNFSLTGLTILVIYYLWT